MTSAERQIPNCAGPVFASRPATFTPPLLACDCHAHVFGPLDQFPMVPDRLYTPPEASLADYTHLLDTLGFQRGVIVQPSVYGTDNRATLEATASDPDKFRAVVVVDGSIALDQLQSYHQQGARGVRCNLLFSGDKAMQDVRRIADKIAPLDWHLQVLLDVSTFTNVHHVFSNLPVQTVFDHMGHFPADKGINDPGFRDLLRLMGEGKAWAKLSGAYRFTGMYQTPYQDVVPIAQALVAANPNHVVFGTDWPHPHIPVAMPDDGALLSELLEWAPDQATRDAILVDNPARLYGF
ncbi:4-sulfomuconolactone hydrolase [Falsiruegeria litorea R37]|uniref:4-sulfomuconolactone hydrolase n=1 Tax=Falsiruegeria litorea R37 TaxID=1200284 RepID=A0A1Y5RKG6_9RHOB|nr:amidohydrolase family protein [Falsiruegeria litorea]SLN19707.1 4-sulfomuconolactone hydrolase [Falsiruegeria litorea R37]